MVMMVMVMVMAMVLVMVIIEEVLRQVGWLR
jgi:hypothetical protein